MSYLGRATGIKLARDIKGTNTLTFQMPTKFFDSEKGDFVKNEYIEELFNERKVKLKFQKQWYEFYIKKISESKQFKAIMKTFTCDDSFIDELSRTGYGITFDTELYNNVDELGNFSEIIIEDSIFENHHDFAVYLKNIGEEKFASYAEKNWLYGTIARALWEVFDEED